MRKWRQLDPQGVTKSRESLLVKVSWSVVLTIFELAAHPLPTKFFLQILMAQHLYFLFHLVSSLLFAYMDIWIASL